MLIFCAGIISVLAVLYFILLRFERSNLYYPDKEITIFPQSYGLKYDEVFFEAEDGKKIGAWFIGAEKKEAVGTILFCHGNAGNIGHRMEKAKIMSSLGFNVLLFDYRGYGKSEGSPSEKGTYRDGAAAYQYLVKSRDISPERIIFYGESLGAAIATELAHRLRGAGLIVESPFTSVVAMGEYFYPWLPSRWIVRNRYDNLVKMGEIKMPVLIMHSRQDETIPFMMAEQLLAVAPGAKQFFELQGGHNDGFLMTPRYSNVLGDFIAQCVR